MERYSEYKDSGVQWLGEIPSHWEMRSLKYCCSLKGRIGWNGLRSEEFQYSSYAYLVTGQDFIGSEIDWSKCYQISQERYDEDPYIQLNNGDMLITKDGTIGKVAKVTNLDKPACLNSGIFVIKQKDAFFNQGFLYWMFCSNVLKEFNVYTQTGATIAHLYQNVFENMPCILPPVSEQQAIASYLDAATSKIDAAIAQQQKMIDLLNERKQIIINNAVTKGLNPDAPMKDSGVDWIGEIPEHWSLIPIKHIIKFINGYAFDSNDFKSDGDIPVIRISNISDGQVCLDDIAYVSYKKELEPYVTHKGDLLIAMSGATTGKVGFDFDGGLYINQRVGAIRSEHQQFVYYWLNSSFFKEYVLLSALGSAQPNISSKGISNFQICLPTKEEIEEISCYIKRELNKITPALSNAIRQISLLQERKQIIINEVVTGKVKVI